MTGRIIAGVLIVIIIAESAVVIAQAVRNIIRTIVNHSTNRGE